MRVPSPATIRFGIKPLLWLLILSPAAWIGWAIWRSLHGDPSALGTDPAQTIVHLTGTTALRLLLATLLISSLRDLLRMPWLVQLRRLLGLAAFGWACVHLGSYIGFELGGSWSKLLDDLQKRTYILAGTVALLALVPLAITSTRGWQRRLGRDWKRLHRLVYLAALAACVHLVWQARSDLGEALLYSAAFALLAVQRIVQRRPRTSRREPAAATG